MAEEKAAEERFYRNRVALLERQLESERADRVKFQWMWREARDRAERLEAELLFELERPAGGRLSGDWIG